MTEAELLNTILNELVDYPGLRLFRAHLMGQAWVGKRLKLRMPAGCIALEDGRPLRSGLPTGFADLFGWLQCGGVARYVAFEVKTATGRVSTEQANFLKFVAHSGGIAGVIRSSADAIEILRAART
jgi:hypothetical protein